MSLLQRIEPRIGNLGSIVEFSDVPSSDSVKMGQIFGAGLDPSGAAVTPTTSMKVSAAYACCRLIGGAVASLPLPVYERSADGRNRVDHDYWWLFNEKISDGWTAASFWEWVTGNVLLRGDAFVYPVKRGNRMVEGIPLARGQVKPQRVKRELVYDIHDPNFELPRPPGAVLATFRVGSADMLHFAGYGFDGVSSLSVIAWAARAALGIAIRADEFAGQFYGNGAHFQHAITVPGKMATSAQSEFRDAWQETYSGNGPLKIPLILTGGMDVKQLSISPMDAQLLESRKFQVIDIARAFGVPPHMIGESEKNTSWGTGLEQTGIGFVTYTLRPHLTRWCQEMNSKLWPRQMRYFLEFLVDGLMEGDMKTQSEYLAKALGGPGAQGWMKVNEVRRLKNLPPVPNGDDLTLSGATANVPPDPPADPQPDPQPDPAAP